MHTYTHIEWERHTDTCKQTSARHRSSSTSTQWESFDMGKYLPNWKRQTADSRIRNYFESKWEENKSKKARRGARVLSFSNVYDCGGDGNGTHIIMSLCVCVYIYARVFFSQTLFCCCCFSAVLLGCCRRCGCCCYCWLVIVVGVDVYPPTSGTTNSITVRKIQYDICNTT